MLRLDRKPRRVFSGKPSFELRRRLQAQKTPQIEGVVEAGALVMQHHVVGAGDAHDVIHARCAKHGQQRVHVILVGLDVVGVANVATHGQPKKLAAKMIFQPGACNLLPVVQILRPDEPHPC